MDIRTAILKAADKIEADPRSYSFYRGDIAGDGPGCLVVWVCRMAGYTSGSVRERTSPVGFGYFDLLDLYKAHPDPRAAGIFDYIGNAKHGATMLRIYADTYFPATPSSTRTGGRSHPPRSQ